MDKRKEWGTMESVLLSWSDFRLSKPENLKIGTIPINVNVEENSLT